MQKTEGRHAQPLPLAALGAIGVVFGDIGTSPLYTLRECLRESGSGDVLGILSLILWTLTLVVSVKYIGFVMRAHNHGEGGIFALLAIIPDRHNTPKHGNIPLISLVVVIGAALLYGDGAITPAISVLSALEGITVVQPAFERLIVPITCVILVSLFAMQRHGTGVVGILFGPIMVLWFATISVLGAYHIAQNPHVLAALSPHHAVRYFAHNGFHGVLILGAVVLAVTGGEALYADMGHFGGRAIRLAWFLLVGPALLLCYFGQGAMVLSDPSRAENPFFAMVPVGGWTYALVALSSAATIIASQALISGAFSLTQQAMQLGYFPRVQVRHTAAEVKGQIYIPGINAMLAVACIVLVVVFQRSERLASAYGIAVTGTMLLTSIAYFSVMRRTWKWSLWASTAVLVFFLSFDVPFFLANTHKLVEGGWVPLALAFVMASAMLIWKRGRAIIAGLHAKRHGTDERLLAELDKHCMARVPGTAVFMASSREHVPPVLEHYVTHSRTRHEQIILMTVVTDDVPQVATTERVRVKKVGEGFVRVSGHFGFMENPNVPHAIEIAAREHALDVDLDNVTYFLGRESVIASDAGHMREIPERIFGFLARNAHPADRHFGIPPTRVVEIGVQLDL